MVLGNINTPNYNEGYIMYMDTIIITSLLTVGSVVLVTAGIVYAFVKEGEKSERRRQGK